ncbi:MAG: prolyl oligopeptidase family serine peptidase [Mangrovibacterium sp.]
MNYLKMNFTILLTLLLTICGCNKENMDNDNGSIKETEETEEFVFEKGEYSYLNVNLPFREISFNQENEKPSILVIFLHGHSGNGNDNASQLRTGGVSDIANFLSSQGLSSIFLVPQCAANRSWSEITATNGTQMSVVLKNWIDSFVSSHSVDDNRIYVLGASSGGAGVWRMLSDYPDLFAAAMPAVSIPRSVVADSVKQTPIYAIIGANDNVVNVSAVEPFLNEVQAAGGQVKFKIMPNSDHQQAVRDAFSNDCLQWVFSYTR